VSPSDGRSFTVGRLYCVWCCATCFSVLEFNSNFTYMLYSATAEDNVYHKDYLATFDMDLQSKI
jgi:hypothetical protein